MKTSVTYAKSLQVKSQERVKDIPLEMALKKNWM